MPDICHPTLRKIARNVDNNLTNDVRADVNKAGQYGVNLVRAAPVKLPWLVSHARRRILIIAPSAPRIIVLRPHYGMREITWVPKWR